MESWSYVAEGKGFVSDGAVSNTDAIARGKKGLMGCELRTPGNGSSMRILSREATEYQGFVELGFSEMRRNSFLNDPIRGVLSCKNGSGRTLGSTMATPNAFSGEEESSSRPSSSVVESSSRDTSFIDLKLGGLADIRDAQNLSSNQASPILSSSESSSPAKRVRATGSTSQAPLCLVHGCKKDLGSSKEYYRRHKVCEIHSKTPKVIVSGIEQRFCQQCSRFHLLAEFDDGKRSCRKRLACHNERRRKPHVGIHSGRAGSADSRYLGNALITSSFICKDILPSSFVYPSRYETGDTCRRVKTEDGADYKLRSAIPIRNEYLYPKSALPSHSFEKQFPTLDNGFGASTGRDCHENCNQNPNDLIGPNSDSCYFFQNMPVGSEEFTILNSAPTIQGLSNVSASGRALSLLSSQSQNSSSHSSGVPISQPLFLPGSNDHYNANQVSEKLLGVCSQALTTGMSNRFHFPKMNSVEDNHLNPILISDGSNAVNFDSTDGVFPGSEYFNAKDSSSEDGLTIDLLQLSSQLQRVESQRHSMQVKQERDTFCGHKTA